MLANFRVAVFGALMCERLGRRTLWLSSAIGCFCSYIFIIVCSAIFATKGTAAAGQATIAFIYLVSDYESVPRRILISRTVQWILRYRFHSYR